MLYILLIIFITSSICAASTERQSTLKILTSPDDGTWNMKQYKKRFSEIQEKHELRKSTQLGIRSKKSPCATPSTSKKSSKSQK
jgi:hypothetical protein